MPRCTSRSSTAVTSDWVSRSPANDAGWRSCCAPVATWSGAGSLDLAPDAPLVDHTVRLPAGTRRTDLDLVVRHDGRTLVELHPAHHTEAVPPAPAREPALPADTSSVEELVLIGRHLEQYRHATRRAEDYWREALRREPGDARANTELGLWHMRRGELLRGRGVPAARDRDADAAEREST